MTLNGERWFGLRGKECQRKWIGPVAEFSGVRIVSCAVLDNHFHLLSEVPPVGVVPDEQIVRSFAALYPETTPWQPLFAKAL